MLYTFKDTFSNSGLICDHSADIHSTASLFIGSTLFSISCTLLDPESILSAASLMSWDFFVSPDSFKVVIVSSIKPLRLSNSFCCSSLVPSTVLLIKANKPLSVSLAAVLKSVPLGCVFVVPFTAFILLVGFINLST